MTSATFRGIVQYMVMVSAIEEVPDSPFHRFQFHFEAPLELKTGQSVALNGVCFTVRKVERDIFEVVIWEDTWRLTNFSFLRLGDRVNLELPHSETYLDFKQCERENERF